MGKTPAGRRRARRHRRLGGLKWVESIRRDRRDYIDCAKGAREHAGSELREGEAGLR